MEQQITKNGPATTYRNIKDRDYTRFGQKHEGRIEQDQNVEVTPGKVIRLFGEKNTMIDGQWLKRPYDKTFKVGDTAEYDSFNLCYFGEIVSIGAKTVTIEKYGRKHRLNLYLFNCRNVGDMDAKIKQNQNWMD